ncbi:TetR/AcrR family transcriptional regulator [Nocardia sp. NPDC004278]
MPDTPTRRGRRRNTPTKGDLRERAILDAAERQLQEIGFERMTIETVATDVGITRGAFYFYFASKNALLTALVERTVETLRTEIDDADAAGPPETAIRRAVARTAQMWRDHGNVVRAAVDLAPTVPAIEESWHSAVAAIRDTTQGIAERAGIPHDDGPAGARAVATALVWMTERSFYQASRSGGPLDDTAATVTHIWLTALGLAMR